MSKTSLAATAVAALTLVACGGAPPTDTTGGDDYSPEEQQVVEAATNYRDAIVAGDPKAVCRFTSEAKRLELAKELDEAGAVSKLCIKSIAMGIDDQQDAAEGEFAVDRVEVLGRTKAAVDVSVGELTGTWDMVLDNNGWRFNGGALGPAAAEVK